MFVLWTLATVRSANAGIEGPKELAERFGLQMTSNQKA